MTCKGICVRYKVGKPSFGQGRYTTGQKRCQMCEIFIQWDGLVCPCCGYRLRLRPRNMKTKIRLLENRSRQVNPKVPARPILAPFLNEQSLN
jgi:hypothetical protein